MFIVKKFMIKDTFSYTNLSKQTNKKVKKIKLFVSEK